MTALARYSLVVLPLLLAGCLPFDTKEAAAASTETAAPQITAQDDNTIAVPEGSPLRDRLVIGTPSVETVNVTVTAPATVEADPARFSRIFPPLSGRITALNVHLGDAVEEDQALAAIDAPEFAEAESESVHARSALDLAEKTLRRVSSLYEHGVAPRKDMEQAQAEYDQARCDAVRAESRLRQYAPSAGCGLGEPIPIKSPIAGRVIELAASKGEFRNDPAEALMTIADLSQVWLTADVQEKDMRHIHPDGDVEAVFAAYPEETFRGKVLFTGDILTPETRCLKTRIAFDNPDGRLKPGMFATVSFAAGGSSATTIPNTAIFQVNGMSRVYVEVAPWTFAPHDVELGARDGDRTAVLTGLEAASRIVVQEGSLLQ